MIHFEIKTMSCGHCVGSVTETVKKIDPSAEVHIDLADKKVSIQSDKDRATFAKALTEAGYPTV